MAENSIDKRMAKNDAIAAARIRYEANPHDQAARATLKQLMPKNHAIQAEIKAIEAAEARNIG